MKKYITKQSNIKGAGKGLFTKDFFKKGEVIGLAHVDDQPASEIGRNHNHNEKNPTAYSKKINNKRFIYASKDLNPGEEITTNYRMQPELEQPEDFMRKGGSVLKMPNKKNSKGYSRSLSATNKLFTQNFLFAKPKSRKNKVFDPNSKYYAEGGEYEDAELTPEEIEEYRANGYIVDDTIYAKGGESSCLKDEYWNGTKCVKIPKRAKVITDPKEFNYRNQMYKDSLSNYNKNEFFWKGYQPFTPAAAKEIGQRYTQPGLVYKKRNNPNLPGYDVVFKDIVKKPKQPVVKEEPIKEEEILNLPILKPGLIQQQKYQLRGNPLNEKVESEYLEEGSPDTENPMEWVNKKERWIDWDGLQIPYRLPRFRKPGSYGPLIKKGKQRYINLPTIENRNTAYLKEEKNGGALLTKKVTCKKCGWEWDAADGGKDIMSCHKCPGKGLVHAQDGGSTNDYIETDLTEDEIQAYKDGGYIVEDISIPSLNQMQDGGDNQSNGETYKYLERPDSFYKKSLNGRWSISNDSTGNRFVYIEDPKGSRTKELNKNAVTVSSLNKKRKDRLIKLHKEIAFPKEFVDIKDTRTVRATTGKKINPNVDLKGDKYNKAIIDNIIKKSKAVGVDPSTMLAIALQETNFGKKDANLGHALYGDTAYPYGYIDFYKEKLNEAKRAKIDDELLQIQYYNGLGTVTPETEEDYHGFEMQKIYGVPIPAGGINMRKNPLYGKQIVDLRDNVLLKNPYIQKAIKEKKQGGASNDYVDAELTPEEIKDLIAQGYVIEELN